MFFFSLYLHRQFSGQLTDIRSIVTAVCQIKLSMQPYGMHYGIPFTAVTVRQYLVCSIRYSMLWVMASLSAVHLHRTLTDYGGWNFDISG